MINHPLMTFGAQNEAIPATPTKSRIPIIVALVGLAALPFLLRKKENKETGINWRPKSRLPYYNEMSEQIRNTFDTSFLRENVNRKTPTNKAIKDDDDVVRAYEQYGSIMKAAAALNVSHKTVQTRLRIAMYKKHGGPFTKEDIIAMINKKPEILKSNIHGDLIYDVKPYRIWVNKVGHVIIQMYVNSNYYIVDEFDTKAQPKQDDLVFSARPQENELEFSGKGFGFEADQEVEEKPEKIIPSKHKKTADELYETWLETIKKD